MGGIRLFGPPFPEGPEMKAVAKLPRERERWMLSKILGVSPFDSSVLLLTDPQISWILEQFSIDHPSDSTLRQRYEEKVKTLTG